MRQIASSYVRALYEHESEDGAASGDSVEEWKSDGEGSEGDTWNEGDGVRTHRRTGTNGPPRLPCCVNEALVCAEEAKHADLDKARQGNAVSLVYAVYTQHLPTLN